MNIKQLFLVVLCFLSIKIGAQDVHFSYYQFAPSTVSPALTGAYYGNIRATILRRSQWFNVGDSGNDGFNTTNLLLDGNIPFGFKEGDWISAGINLLKEDKSAGVLDLQRGFSGLSVAYHMTLNKKQTSVFTISAKYGSYSNQINNGGDFLSPSSLSNGLTPDIDQLNFDQEGKLNESVNDIHLGFMLSTPVGKKSDIRIGLSSDHLFAPRFDAPTPEPDPGNPDPPLATIVGEQINRRFNFFAQYYTDVNSKLTFNPTILYQTIGSANNLLLQSLFSYHFNESKELYLNFGLGVRLASNMDVPIYLGADYKDWRVGLSFDLNISGLSGSTNNAGAYELGISKVFKWNKKAKVNPKLICPRL